MINTPLGGNGMNDMNHTTQQIDDAALSAWLDKALDAASMAQISAALQQQPALQQRLTAMMCNERKLQQHYTQMAQQPPPATLQALLQPDSSAQASPAAAPVKSLAKQRKMAWQQRLLNWLDALLPRPVLAAAGLLAALGLGMVLGEQTLQRGPVAGVSMPLANVAPEQPLHTLLESAAAGVQQRLDAHTDAVVDLTFRNKSGEFCRQFRIQDTQAGRGSIAVACRQQQGWQMQLAQSSQAALLPDATYRAASGPETGLIDAFIMAHSNGDIMVGEAEQRLLDNDWSVADQQ